MNGAIVTVRGEIPAKELGDTLAHEHVLVDFIGAADYDPRRWNRHTVIQKVFPYLWEARDQGWTGFIDCTPAYVGRDVVLLKRLSEMSGLHILTNTGYYGGSNPKYLPEAVFTKTDRELAAIWIEEFRNGIEGTGIRPGFIKISVNAGPLTEASQKLIRAAAAAHLETGLTIVSHTGPGVPALEQLEILKKEGVTPEAFVWTHAQQEKDRGLFIQAARDGAWISLDGVKTDNIASYVDTLTFLKKENCLHRVLLSHDAGWYDPAKPDGGKIRGYTALRNLLLPALWKSGFTNEEIAGLIRENPARAFALRVRRTN